MKKNYSTKKPFITPNFCCQIFSLAHLEAEQFQKKFGFWSTKKCSKASKTCFACALIYF